MEPAPGAPDNWCPGNKVVAEDLFSARFEDNSSMELTPQHQNYPLFRELTKKMSPSRAALVLSDVAFEKSNTNIFNKAFAKRAKSTHSGKFAVKVPARPPSDIQHLLETALKKTVKRKKRSAFLRKKSPPAPAYQVERWHQHPDTQGERDLQHTIDFMRKRKEGLDKIRRVQEHEARMKAQRVEALRLQIGQRESNHVTDMGLSYD